MELLKQTQSFFDMLEAKYRSGGIGRHGRFKICWAQALKGSSPFFGTEFPLVHEKSSYWVYYNRAIV